MCVCAFLWGKGSIGSIRFAKETMVKGEQHSLELLVHLQSLQTVCSSPTVTRKDQKPQTYFVPRLRFAERVAVQWWGKLMGKQLLITWHSGCSISCGILWGGYF